MLVTKILAGRPYQSYVPQPLMPVIEKREIDIFRRMDQWLASTVDHVAFSERIASAVAQPNNKLGASDQLASSQRAADMLLIRPRVGIKHLKKVNALLLDRQDVDFRKTPVWVSAPHPAVSWHVGSPPDMLNGMVKGLLADPPTHHPASLTAIVLLFRLLQIHPFSDGNGRTARLWSVHPIYQRIGPACGYLQLLNSLWDRARFDIHTLSLAAQSEETLSPVFDHLEATLNDLI
ncbi:MAG: Fic family protein [Lysobacteraceae bacterium]